jgi:pseudaminic acid synthase
MTLDHPGPLFEVGGGTLWDGRRLYDLYAEAATPWEWYSDLVEVGSQLGVAVFSTPFDRTAVDFLEGFAPPAYKVASFELIDLPLIRDVAATGRPVIMSTGMATVAEIDAAVASAVSAGAGGVVLLRCNSGYPAEPGEMDLRTIPDMVARWGLPVGLSDHTLSSTATIASVALGACAVEKHLTLSRSDPGPDSAFSIEPAELAELVRSVRETEAALGTVRYGPSPSERKSVGLRRSVFAVRDIDVGETFTVDNVARLRPAGGMSPADFDRLLGRRAGQRLPRGTPVTWDAVRPPGSVSP